MAKVTLKDVEKVYPNGFKAVHGIDLDIKDGEFMVFVGPSGCAKSTTLRMIAGLESISGGTISIGDRVVNDVAPKDRKIAMVFQNYALYPHMTVYDNMAFSLKMKKMPKDEINKRVTEAAKALELEDLLKRKPKQLSGGQRQRVAVGRAIVRDPEVFLFDEPLSNLDAKLRVHMRVQLSQLHQKLKTTMIYVTHDQVEAMTMGDRICVLDKGNIMQVDTPLNLYHYPENKFVAGFIGSPAMNLIKGKLVKRNDDLMVEVNDTLLKLSKEKAEKVKDHVGKEVWFGIRPEYIGLKEEGSRAKMDGLVEVLEHMGNETFIYFKLGELQITSRIDSLDSKLLKTNTKAAFYVDMDKCHIFDYDTEKNISL
ncbi:ABC transporter ATP-binding protein [Anaeromicrobium sediminis]|uniref:Sugar ABC transporter ATP-binding protein n=1 Tax=Anaeromicrobium sediminis TaxID=1478221 RepID=A0A267MLP6_9FIRM|nr:sn-glycerol-3-phosphate ABC transporter ATP-binding protein UgpC [Anaeromicrobium sediminis]PAB59690.1 sugar ABC transporter ATP-binding protein [Anaeromicrobium sediminis]